MVKNLLQGGSEKSLLTAMRLSEPPSRRNTGYLVDHMTCFRQHKEHWHDKRHVPTKAWRNTEWICHWSLPSATRTPSRQPRFRQKEHGQQTRAAAPQPWPAVAEPQAKSHTQDEPFSLCVVRHLGCLLLQYVLLRANLQREYFNP